HIVVELGNMQLRWCSVCTEIGNELFQSDPIEADRAPDAVVSRHLYDHASTKTVTHGTDAVMADLFGQPGTRHFQILGSHVLIHCLHELNAVREFGFLAGFKNNARFLSPEEIGYHDVEALGAPFGSKRPHGIVDTEDLLDKDNAGRIG